MAWSFLLAGALLGTLWEGQEEKGKKREIKGKNMRGGGTSSSSCTVSLGLCSVAQLNQTTVARQNGYAIEARCILQSLKPF